MNIVSGHVTRVSLRTAAVCLDRLSVFVNGESVGANFYAPSNVRDGTISIDQLVEIALKHALEMKLVRLGWQELQAAVSADPILLLLRNQNAVVAVRAATNAADQIVVFDPLYRDGEDFLLPRQMLEAAWDGNAILVQQRPVILKPKHWSGFGSLAFLCTVTAALGLVLFYPTEGGNENFLFTATQHDTSSEPLPSGEARSHIPAQAPIPDAEMSPASDTNPFVVSIPPPTPRARSPGPNAMKEPVRPNSDPATVVLRPAGPAAVPASAPKPKKDALTTVAPDSDTATVVLKPAGPGAVPASAPKPKKDALTTVAPNSDTATVVSKPAGTGAPARAPETDALTASVPANSKPTGVASKPADSAAAPPNAPDALTAPVPANSEPTGGASKPAGTGAPARAPKTDALTASVPANSEPTGGASKPAGTGAPASAPETDALTASVPANSEPTGVVSKPADSAAAPPNAPETGALPTQVAPNSDVGQVSAVASKPRKLVSSAKISALVARGDALFGTGDLTSARLLYERAADAGYGPAALRLGESYDPSFPALKRMAIRGDAALAARWYRRAHELGVAEAEILLNALQR
jgi:hypothetical protein